MTDISIKNQLVNQQAANLSKDEKKFEELQKEYKKFIGNTAKSDMKNSPTVLSHELELLIKMALYAKEDSDKNWISSRIKTIEEMMDNQKTDSAKMPYYTDLLNTTKENGNISILSVDNLWNKDKVKDMAEKLLKADISPEVTDNILKSLILRSNETQDLYIFDSDINTIIRLKKALMQFKNNEKKEQANPINKQGMSYQDSDFGVIVMKDNKVVNVIDKDKSAFNIQKSYDDYYSEKSDKFLLDFISRFRQFNTPINSNYLRLCNNLLQNGVTIDYLNDYIKFCSDKDGINEENLNSIISLKSQGVLDKDIPNILTTIKENNEGLTNKTDLANAGRLTSYYIDGEKVQTLLPLVKQNPDLFYTIDLFTNKTENRAYLTDIINEYLTTQEGTIDVNAMDTINNILRNNALDNDSEAEYIETIKRILNEASNEETSKISDEGAGIVAIMSKNNESEENILKGIKLCKDNNGDIDTNLSKILWNLSIQNASITEISDILSKCRTQDGQINTNLTNTIISYLDNGEDKEKLKQFLNI